MLAARGAVAREGDTVLLLRGHFNLTPLVLRCGGLLHCKEGKFRHDDIIGQPLGTRVTGQSNFKGDTSRPPSLLVLQNSADLWTQAVPHRTQIIYDTDIAVIIFNLRLGPGCRIAEAGTGSGSLTHSFAKTVAPNGTVYTFDFHKGRCLEARQEFRRNGLPASLVTCNWRDVCSTSCESGVMAGVEEEIGAGTDPKHGFGLPRHHVDAVFLDVPAPWLAIENVLQVLRPGGMLCTFSPCIEQSQRTAQRLREEPFEFIDIRTVEALTKYFKPSFKRGREEDGRPSRPKLRPALVSKGHSAYLTFARRRLERLPGLDAEIEERNDGNPSSGEEENTAS
ncbi:putative tRNA methyltransferase complex subunit [Trypanosoma rangeli]|uniref:tRNA (adenine(58)-N(1))-methyltransferase n=1 Tax=Trypanosoma rangeli TaxID=5698 RepID=A0A3R7LPM7_TRYRA|nr:putative tRNA methyltransferase complex subunit [Trypanosoma rangeli]RNF00982.1 putative tRNA methyltransferase complex subunit [Trypanosoma rangeli]|eukprot:RNF00982.1 putative tRNA methyltransferase complex subunit [Trypanosoma rangeli]